MTPSVSSESEQYATPRCVLVIYNEFATWQRGEPHEVVADQETLHTALSVAETLRGRYAVTLTAVRNEDDVRAALASVDLDSTLVFNLCESLDGLPTNESRITRVLDNLGACYVGGHGANLDACVDKARAKTRLQARGIPTATYQVFRNADEQVTVPLPAIIKPLMEDSSIGIGADSVVSSVAALRRRVAYVLRVYRQPALAEMFLDGREFTVSVWGNSPAQAVGVSEIDFSECDDPAQRVRDFDTKWCSGRFPVLHPAPVDAGLHQQLEQLGVAAYGALDCRDYARVDIREKDGQLYVLEVNPNPALAEDDSFVRSAQAAGHSYAQVISQLASWAWLRRRAQPMIADSSARRAEVTPTQLDEAAIALI